jgi:hypothetical protein
MNKTRIIILVIILIVVGSAIAILTSQSQIAAPSLAPAVTPIETTTTVATSSIEPVAPSTKAVMAESETYPEVDQAEESTTPTLEAETPIEPILPAGVVSGVVYDIEGPVADASVRVQNTDNHTLSAADGSFTLSGLTSTNPVTVTAWANGYYVSGVSAVPGLAPITITINAYHTTDNTQYPFAETETCAECHQNHPEWQADAHGQAALNPRFLTMYEGTDVHGNESVVERDASGLPLPPEPDQPYYGPGFKLDYPDRTGNCAACHTPAASTLEPDNTCGWSGCHTNFTASMSDQVPPGISPTNLVGAATEGIFCDFCHKIGDVILDPDSGLPYSARPGISSIKLYRPNEDQDLFLGTFDDVPGFDSYLPLQEESSFCAPCHYGVFGGVTGSHDVTGGVQIYNSFGEWLESPYSDPETGQTCQDCHMPPVDYEYFVFPEKGGLPRDPNRIHSHLMPGATNETLLQNSVTMETSAQLTGNEVWVEVSVTNDKTGHHVPTGTPLRHMILVVQARDAQGNLLPVRDGSVLPTWTGNFAGQPGWYYAKILEDEWTAEFPTAAFWRDIHLVEDTRLAPLATDVSQYSFEAPAAGPITVEAKLVFRRAFHKLMEQKGWNDPDIVMEEETVVIEAP